MPLACVCRARALVLAAALVGLFTPGCAPPQPGGKAESFSLDRGGIDRVKDEALLRGIQGDVLRHHERTYAVALFLAFRPAAGRETARRWLGDFAARRVTSAFEQDDVPVFGGVYLSRTGYDALGLPYPAGAGDLFLNGMRHEDSRGQLADPEVGEWEKGYRDAIDALVVLAANRRADLDRAEAEVRRQAVAVCDVRAVERLGVKTNARGQKVEHFGYVDEISQPVFFASEAPKDPGAGFDPRAPLSLVLVQEDPEKYPERCGSFLAVRKLRQDVRKFAAQVKELAGTLHVSEDLAAALVVGRFRDGTPVALSDVPKAPGKDQLNGFTFAGDADGHRCPLHAHVRRLNPRGSTAHPGEEAGHRIARRSMLYGLDDGPEAADREVGTLFLCFQASLEDQFAFLQGDWAASTKHLRDGNAPDPLLATDRKVVGSGQAEGLPPPDHQWWTPWGAERKVGKAVGHPFAHCVAFRGGEYFFAPSLGLLRSLR